MNKENIVISIENAKTLALTSQGLTRNKTFPKGKSGVLEAIRHLAYIQIDTVSVIERAHHHSLWTRVENYKSKHLDALIEEKKIFEYWFHAASFLPIQDYRYCLPRMNSILKGDKHWFTPNKKLMNSVLNRIKAEGSLGSKDFENPKKNKGGMWNWKPAKIALEQLFMSGKLMISKRINFQKVYDLTSRVLPTDININPPKPDELARFLIITTLRTHGLANLAEISYLRKGIKGVVEKELKKMLEEKLIVPVNIEGSPTDYYVSKSSLNILESKTRAKTIKVMSPFDNAVIQRKRLLQLYNYDFQLECYVPEKKRNFGYFALPILYGNNFIARADCKADRNTQTLIIRNLLFEKNFKDYDTVIELLGLEFKNFANFNSCKNIKIEKVNPKKVKSILQKSLI